MKKILIILICIFAFTYSIYPFIINDESIKSLDEMMSTFPPEIIKAFNMDKASLTTAYGWFMSEGYMFIQILVGLYAILSFYRLGDNYAPNTFLRINKDRTIDVYLKRNNKSLLIIIYIIKNYYNYNYN